MGVARRGKAPTDTSRGHIVSDPTLKGWVPLRDFLWTGATDIAVSFLGGRNSPSSGLFPPRLFFGRLRSTSPSRPSFLLPCVDDFGIGR